MLKLNKRQKMVLLMIAQNIEVDEGDRDFYDQLNEGNNFLFLISLLKSEDGGVTFGIVTESFKTIFTEILQESWRIDINEAMFESINKQFIKADIEPAVFC